MMKELPGNKRFEVKFDPLNFLTKFNPLSYSTRCLPTALTAGIGGSSLCDVPDSMRTF